MDINSDVVNPGNVGGGAGILAFLKLLWNDWNAKQEKREMQQSIDKLGEEIEKHSLYDVQTFSTKDDMRNMFTYWDKKMEGNAASINAKLDSLQTMLLNLVKDSYKGKK